jgi:hypothetical protein
VHGKCPGEVVESEVQQFRPAERVAGNVREYLFQLIDRHHGDRLDMHSRGRFLLKYLIGIGRKKETLHRRLVAHADRKYPDGLHCRRDCALVHSFAGRGQLEQSLWLALLIAHELQLVVGDELRFVSAALRGFRQQRRLDLENHHHIPEIQKRVNLTALVRQVRTHDSRRGRIELLEQINCIYLEETAPQIPKGFSSFSGKGIEDVPVHSRGQKLSHEIQFQDEHAVRVQQPDDGLTARKTILR